MKKFICFVGIVLLCVVMFFLGQWNGHSVQSVANQLSEKEYKVILVASKDEIDSLGWEFDLDAEKIECAIYAMSLDDDSWLADSGIFFCYEKSADAKKAYEEVKEYEDDDIVVEISGKFLYIGQESVYEDGIEGASILNIFK